MKKKNHAKRTFWEFEPYKKLSWQKQMSVSQLSESINTVQSTVKCTDLSLTLLIHELYCTENKMHINSASGLNVHYIQCILA